MYTKCVIKQTGRTNTKPVRVYLEKSLFRKKELIK